MARRIDPRLARLEVLYLAGLLAKHRQATGRARLPDAALLGEGLAVLLAAATRAALPGVGVAVPASGLGHALLEARQFRENPHAETC